MEGGLMLSGSHFRDFIGLVYDVCDHESFWAMRLVCKMWHSQSLRNQSHWYTWLVAHGTCTGWRLRDHFSYAHLRCRGEPGCVHLEHYENVTRIPLVLKTVPLPTQVLRQAIAHKKRRLSGFLHLALKSKEHAEHKAMIARQEVDVFAEKLAVLERISAHYPVKRRKQQIRLNISKADEK